MVSYAQVTRRAGLPKKFDALWVNRDGVSIPASLGMEIKLRTVECAKASKLNNFAYPGIVCYRENVCSSFKAKVISTVHTDFSTTNVVSLDHKH